MFGWRVRRRGDGFTLIEVLITIVIIGILTAIALPIFTGYHRKAQDALAMSDLRQAYTAVNGYWLTLDDPSGSQWESGEILPGSPVMLPNGVQVAVSTDNREYLYVDPTGGAHDGFCMVVLTVQNDEYWANNVDGMFMSEKQKGQGPCTAISGRSNL